MTSGRTMNDECQLSIVVPIYNEADAIPHFFAKVTEVLQGITEAYEIVCVDDRSTDKTPELLRQLQGLDGRIKVITLTRNFGKEVALTAGLDHATGNAVIPIDADLQDPPELIPRLIEKWKEGYDVVLAIRSNRGNDSFSKRVTANVFYEIVSRLSKTRIPKNAGDFRLMDRKVVEAVKLMPERSRFMKGLFAWVGFRQTTVTYTRAPRIAGETKWPGWKLWNFALDGLFSFTTVPLRIWTYIGLTVASFALIYMMVIVIRVLIFGIDVPGYASLIVTLTFFSGLNMIGLGVLGEYMGRVFMEVKRRPLYLVDETQGFDKKQEG
jgi:glycosyltransferase involved in cell wall biosynthesis